MIAFKTFKTGATSLLLLIDETQIGGAGGQNDFGGYRLDATDSTSAIAIAVRLPLSSLSEGRAIWFTVVNPSLKIITVARASSGDSAQIHLGGGAANTISTTSELAQVILQCTGDQWYALSDGTFS